MAMTASPGLLGAVGCCPQPRGTPNAETLKLRAGMSGRCSVNSHHQNPALGLAPGQGLSSTRHQPAQCSPGHPGTSQRSRDPFLPSQGQTLDVLRSLVAYGAEKHIEPGKEQEGKRWGWGSSLQPCRGWGWVGVRTVLQVPTGTAQLGEHPAPAQRGPEGTYRSPNIMGSLRHWVQASWNHCWQR